MKFINKMSQFKKIFLTFLTVSIVTAAFLFSPIKNNIPIARASFLDVIRALVTINPLELNIPALSEAVIDEVFKVEARIKNKGEEKIDSAQAEIFLHEDLVLVRKKPVQHIGVIPRNKEKKASWQIKGEKSGKYVISISVQGELKEHRVSIDASTIVTIVDEASQTGPGSSLSPGLWQRLLNFLQTWLKH